MSDPYFAYGSNLDEADWSRFCREHGFDPDALRPLGPALLEREALVFDYRSARRGCGVLNIRSGAAGAVDGVLFEVDPDGWASLDLKEGHPHRYRREPVTVRDPAGRAIAAWTYRVVAALRVGFVAPSPHYLAVCRAGRRRFGLSLEPLEVAARGTYPRDSSRARSFAV